MPAVLWEPAGCCTGASGFTGAEPGAGLVAGPEDREDGRRVEGEERADGDRQIEDPLLHDSPCMLLDGQGAPASTCRSKGPRGMSQRCLRVSGFWREPPAHPEDCGLRLPRVVTSSPARRSAARSRRMVAGLAWRASARSLTVGAAPWCEASSRRRLRRC